MNHNLLLHIQSLKSPMYIYQYIKDKTKRSDGLPQLEKMARVARELLEKFLKECPSTLEDLEKKYQNDLSIYFEKNNGYITSSYIDYVWIPLKFFKLVQKIQPLEIDKIDIDLYVNSVLSHYAKQEN